MVRFLLTATPTGIPTGPAVVTSTIEVAGAGAYLTDLDLITNITHTFAADLDITLQSPAGTVATITTDNGAGNNDVFAGTTFDDQANPGVQTLALQAQRAPAEPRRRRLAVVRSGRLAIGYLDARFPAKAEAPGDGCARRPRRRAG